MITSLDQVTEFPLCWPDTKPRAAKRVPAQFKTSMAKAAREIEEEMKRWRARGYVVSMAPQHRQGAVDPGVAVWFNMPPRQSGAAAELRVLASDNYMLREHNLHAIALTLGGLRAFERYGTYSMWQAIEGARLALPGPNGEKPLPPWWAVLEVQQAWPLPAIEGMYRDLAKRHAGDEGKLRSLNLAIEAARKAKAAP